VIAFGHAGRWDKREPNKGSTKLKAATATPGITLRGEKPPLLLPAPATGVGSVSRGIDQRLTTVHVTSTRKQLILRRQPQQSTRRWPPPLSLALGPPCRPQIRHHIYADRSQVCWMTLSPHGCYGILLQSCTLPLLILSLLAKTMGRTGYGICLLANNCIARSALWSK
jgi:hypothetical protein